MSRDTRDPRAGVLAATIMLASFGLGLIGACNSNPVQYLTAQGGIVKSKQTPVGGQIPMDILWVVDNSFSMCQEQKVLRDNFDLFIGEIQKTNLDFHIALTTTHAPFSPFSIEVVAERGLIQSTPQPVPGNNATCIRGDGMVNGVQTQFAPLRESLQVARNCLADPSTASQYEWTDQEIGCAIRGDMACDYNEDGAADTFDLFPDYPEYRTIPKVLRAQDYQNAQGGLDAARLRADFSCMATVGTRGDGYEKGLLAAVEAVSLENTGGAVGAEGADTSAPNHGFLRQDSGFALIFVSDENDCSHDGSIEEQGGTCGPNACEYHNSTAISEADSALLAIPDLADQMRNNLQNSKGRAVESSSLLVAGIYGTWNRFTQPFPQCSPDADENPAVPTTCSSPQGDAFSGDRYERFMRQFVNHYPNTVVSQNGPEARLDFAQTEPLGWMCSETFAPALQAIGEFVSGINPSCISDQLISCEQSSSCPQRLFGGPGQCQMIPGEGMEQGFNFCDSGLTIKITRDPNKEATFPNIGDNPYCRPESIDQIDPDSCIVDYGRYSWIPCSAGVQGIQFSWAESDAMVNNILSGYTLEVIYNVVFDE